MRALRPAASVRFFGDRFLDGHDLRLQVDVAEPHQHVPDRHPVAALDRQVDHLPVQRGEHLPLLRGHQHPVAGHPVRVRDEPQGQPDRDDRRGAAQRLEQFSPVQPLRRPPDDPQRAPQEHPLVLPRVLQRGGDVVGQQVELRRQARGEAALGDLLHHDRAEHLRRLDGPPVLRLRVRFAQVPVAGEQRDDRDQPAGGFLEVVRQRPGDLRRQGGPVGPRQRPPRPALVPQERRVPAVEQQRLPRLHHRAGQPGQPLRQVGPLVDRLLPADGFDRVAAAAAADDAHPVHVQQPAGLVRGDAGHVPHAAGALEQQHRLLEVRPEPADRQVRPRPLRPPGPAGEVLRGVAGERFHELQKARPRLRNRVGPLQHLQRPARRALRDEGGGEVQVGGGQLAGRVRPVLGAALPGGEGLREQRGDGVLGPRGVPEPALRQAPLVGQGELAGVQRPHRRGRRPQTFPQHVEQFGEELLRGGVGPGHPLDLPRQGLDALQGAAAGVFVGHWAVAGRAVRRRPADGAAADAGVGGPRIGRAGVGGRHGRRR